VTSDPIALKEAALLLAAKFPKEGNVILAPGMGAMALATAVQLELKELGILIPVLPIRSPSKIRPGERLVEGFPPKSKINAVFIDDLISEGNTYKETLSTIKEFREDSEIIAALLLIDISSLSGARSLRASGLPIYSCFSRQDLGISRDCISVTKGLDRIECMDITHPLEVIDLRYGTESRKNDFNSTPVWIGQYLIAADKEGKVSRPSNNSSIVAIYPLNDSKRGFSQDTLVDEDCVVLAGYNGNVYKLKKDLTKAWICPVAKYIHATPIKGLGGYLVVGEEFEDNKAGGSLSLVSLQGELMKKIIFSEDYGVATPGIFENIVVVSSNDSTLKGIENWEIKWSIKTQGLVRGGICVHNNYCYVATEEGFICKINPVNGDIIWEIKLVNSFEYSRPIIHNNLLVVCDSEIHTHGIDLQTGERKWVTRTRSPVWQRPTITQNNGLILVGEKGDISYIDSQGLKQAETKIGDNLNIRQPGSISDKGILAIIDDDFQIRTFKLNNLCYM
jgi:orotate phosphoribosyltransferase/outer membrane protein assembly factor BamB